MDQASARWIALVTSHPWHIPHPTNDHVAELAEGLHQLHLRDPQQPDVVVIASSADTQARRRTRRALRDLARGAAPADVFGAPELDAAEPGGSVDGPRYSWPLLALPVARGPATVSLRSALRIVLERGELELLHLHDPLDGELTRVAARRWSGLTMATFHSAPAPAVLPLLSAPLRERILSGIDRWLVPVEVPIAESLESALGAVPELSAVPTIAEAIPLHTEDDTDSSGEHVPTRQVVLARAHEDEATVRDFLRGARQWLEGEPDIEVVVLDRWGHHHRPTVPRWLKGRLHTVQAHNRSEAERILRHSSAVVVPLGAPVRTTSEAGALGVPVVAIDDCGIDDVIRRLQAVISSEAPAVEALPTISDMARETTSQADQLRGLRHVHIPGPASQDRTCVIDLHMHTNHSWDCATDPEALLFAARKVGLTAIAVTDHDEISGALAVAAMADEYGIQVIVGEEVKTSQGEVIGLFLTERIEPGLTWHETIARIREQNGLVYVPHPFDRLHTIPDVHTLRESLNEIDAFETYNSRLTFEQYNRDAERFARKYNLIEGAGSDAHVVQGLGTAAVHMPAWDDPESFLVALRQGEIIKRPKSLMYLQGLKRVAQIAGRAGTGKQLPDSE